MNKNKLSSENNYIKLIHVTNRITILRHIEEIHYAMNKNGTSLMLCIKPLNGSYVYFNLDYYTITYNHTLHNTMSRDTIKNLINWGYMECFNNR